MKFLKAALVFSQAAQSIAAVSSGSLCSRVSNPTTTCPVTKNNYQQKLCTPDSDVFVIPPNHDMNDIVSTNREISNVYDVRTAYTDYCYTLGKYNQAVNKKNGLDKPGDYYACSPQKSDDECIVESGIDLATSCEKLRHHKKYNTHAFEHYVSRPQTCAPFRPKR